MFLEVFNIQLFNIGLLEKEDIAHYLKRPSLIISETELYSSLMPIYSLNYF